MTFYTQTLTKSASPFIINLSAIVTASVTGAVQRGVRGLREGERWEYGNTSTKCTRHFAMKVNALHITARRATDNGSMHSCFALKMFWIQAVSSIKNVKGRRM